MAQLALIKAETASDGLQYMGDVVGVYSDDHQFSGTELEKFSILTINGSMQEVGARLEQIIPRVETACKWESDGKYHWEEPPDDEKSESEPVFRTEGSNRWYKLVSDFKFPLNIFLLTAEEKQLLETVDIHHPSVDSFVRKLVKDVTVLSGNDVEIKELRNSEP